MRLLSVVLISLSIIITALPICADENWTREKIYRIFNNPSLPKEVFTKSHKINKWFVKECKKSEREEKGVRGKGRST